MGERGTGSAWVRRRQRRRQWLMGVLAACTVLSLLAIAGFVREISRQPVLASPAALTATARATHSATARPSSPRPSPSASTPAVTARHVRDTSTGLSYRLLSRPWKAGCPGVLRTPVFSWSAGENAVAGTADIGGTVTDWHGNACSGRLPPAFAYSGPADLEPVTMTVAEATDPAYYSGLTHDRTLTSSTSLQVSGHQAWLVTFTVSYPDAAREQLAWASETGAVVVVDRGTATTPAVFYASVPSNLGTGTVTGLLGSLRLTVSPG